MYGKIIPFNWEAKDLKLVNYYRYTSYVIDRFIEFKSDDFDKDEFQEQKLWFCAIKDKVEKAKIDLSEAQDGSDIKTNQWDNKIVIEVETPQSNRIFIGFKDWTYCIGLGRDGDKWIKPQRFV